MESLITPGKKRLYVEISYGISGPKVQMNFKEAFDLRELRAVLVGLLQVIFESFEAFQRSHSNVRLHG